jgi:hypothetical protein
MPASNRPTQYQRSANITRTRQATIARQDEALRLRRSGMSYIEIARTLGFTPNGIARPQSAAEAVRAAERRLVVANADGAVATVAQTATVSHPSLPSNRTFGFECEFFGITVPTALNALRSIGLDADFETYHANTVPSGWWKITTDGSVTARGTGMGRGLEMVSPVLRGEQGLEIASKAVKALLNAGAKVDRTCGLHVHLGMDGLSGADLIKVVEFYSANQNNINNVVSQSRHNTRWAKRYDTSVYRTAFESIRNTNSTSELRNAVGRFDRYMTVNLTSYSKYGTVEFRQHQGTLNAEKVVSWVKFVMALTEKAVATTDPTEAFASFPELLGNLPLSEETVAFLNRRSETLVASR